MEKLEDIDKTRSLFVGSGVLIEGKIETLGEVEIHGTVKGEIVANYIQVGEQGVVEGGLRAAKVEINGFASRAIDVTETLTIGKAGRVEGDVIYGSIQIDAGATIFGNIRQREQHLDTDTTASEYLDTADTLTTDNTVEE